MLASKQYIFCLSCESVFENSFLIVFIGTCILFSRCSDGASLRLRFIRPAKTCSVARESFPVTIPNWIAWLIYIVFD